MLTTCALPSWASNCDGAINGAQSYIRGAMSAQLATLYAAIRTRAPSAVVVVVGYPRIFNGQDCNALTWFSSSEETKLNATADLLNATTAAQAAAAGFRFANPTTPFIGHAWCGSPEWINGLSYPISESYHPNRSGHASGYTPTVSPQLTGAVVTVTRSVRAAARDAAGAQAALQRTYADADARIAPESFQRPDLRSPEVRRAAARHGIDLDRWLARQGSVARRRRSRPCRRWDAGRAAASRAVRPPEDEEPEDQGEAADDETDDRHDPEQQVEGLAVRLGLVHGIGDGLGGPGDVDVEDLRAVVEVTLLVLGALDDRPGGGVDVDRHHVGVGTRDPFGHLDGLVLDRRDEPVGLESEDRLGVVVDHLAPGARAGRPSRGSPSAPRRRGTC